MLITSQNPNWPHGQALEVPVLDTEVAADFLVTRTGDPDRQAARELAGELGGLPLALEQAAAYILATGGSLAGYLASVPATAAPTCWAAASRPGTAGRWPPPGRWRSAELEQSAPAAVGLLRLLAFCAPEAIPLRLLLQPRPGLAEELRPEVAPAAGAAAGGSAGGRGRDRGAAPVLAGHPGRATGRCRCTGWCRRSPPTRCPRIWRRRGGRPPPR